MANKAQKIPRTSAQAKKSTRYRKLAGKHSAAEKKKWLMIKQKGKWQLARAASATASGPHTVCYYDPNTGFYDDCHTT